jgi:hypothetical protein
MQNYYKGRSFMFLQAKNYKIPTFCILVAFKLFTVGRKYIHLSRYEVQ